MSSPNQLTVIEKKRLYVGCSLTQAPEWFVSKIDLFKGELRKDWDVLEFLGTTAGTAADVYRQDIIENVGSCDAFLGVADFPAIGLGYETAIAVEKHHKPTLVTAQAGTKVTRMILGIPEFHPNMTFAAYGDMLKDVPVLAQQVFAPVLGREAIARTVD